MQMCRVSIMLISARWIFEGHLLFDVHHIFKPGLGFYSMNCERCEIEKINLNLNDHLPSIKNVL